MFVISKSINFFPKKAHIHYKLANNLRGVACVMDFYFPGKPFISCAMKSGI